MAGNMLLIGVLMIDFLIGIWYIINGYIVCDYDIWRHKMEEC